MMLFAQSLKNNVVILLNSLEAAPIVNIEDIVRTYIEEQPLVISAEVIVAKIGLNHRSHVCIHCTHTEGVAEFEIEVPSSALL